MGVLACQTPECENIMCEATTIFGYICKDCLKKLMENPIEFLEVKSNYSYSPWEINK